MIREDVVNSYGYKVAKASVDYSQKYAKDDELQGIVMDTFEDAAEFGYEDGHTDKDVKRVLSI